MQKTILSAVRNLAVAVALFAAGQSSAAVFYVEKFGDDNNSCRNLNTPCLTIGAALNKGSGPDTVTVGIGTYEEPVTLDRVGLKLLSRGGHGVTFIDASTWVNTAGVTVTADRVRVGKRNRGFRIVGGITGDGVHAMGNGLLLEGNRIEGGMPIPNNFPFPEALLSHGSQVSVRYNIFLNSIRFVPVSESVAGVSRLFIADNQFLNGGIGITSTVPVTGHRVQNNQLLGGGIYMLLTAPGDDFLGEFPTRTNDRVVGNDFGGGFVLLQGGNPLVERNLAGSIRMDNSTDSVVRRNLISGQYNNPGIMLVQDPVNITVSNNTVTGVQQGLLLSRSGNVSALKQFRNNNFSDASFCMFDFVEYSTTSPQLNFVGNFYGAADIPDLSCSRGGDELLAAGTLTFRQRAIPNRY